MRQKDPALKEVVEQLSRGNVREAIERFDMQGHVHEIPDRDERLKEIAQEYAKKPEATLVVSLDNQSRREINDAIHGTGFGFKTGGWDVNSLTRPGTKTPSGQFVINWRRPFGALALFSLVGVAMHKTIVSLTRSKAVPVSV